MITLVASPSFLIKYWGIQNKYRHRTGVCKTCIALKSIVYECYQSSMAVSLNINIIPLRMTMLWYCVALLSNRTTTSCNEMWPSAVYMSSLAKVLVKMTVCLYLPWCVFLCLPFVSKTLICTNQPGPSHIDISLRRLIAIISWAVRPLRCSPLRMMR